MWKERSLAEFFHRLSETKRVDVGVHDRDVSAERPDRKAGIVARRALHCRADLASHDAGRALVIATFRRRPVERDVGAAATSIPVGESAALAREADRRPPKKEGSRRERQAWGSPRLESLAAEAAGKRPAIFRKRRPLPFATAPPEGDSDAAARPDVSPTPSHRRPELSVCARKIERNRISCDAADPHAVGESRQISPAIQ